MKKKILTLALIFCLASFSFATPKVIDNTKENMWIICLGTGLAIWGYSQKSFYGTVTGSMCALSVLLRFEW